MTLPKNQHHVPRFLLRAFGRERKAGEYFTTVYRKDRVFPVNVSGVGGERYFYNRPEENELEALISEQESSLAEIHRELACNTDYSSFDKEGAAELIAHCWVRSKSLRMEISETIGTYSETLYKMFVTPEQRLAFLKHQIQTVPNFLEDILLDSAESGESFEWLVEMCRENPERLFDLLNQEVFEKLVKEYDPSRFDPIELARDTQLRVLAENPNPRAHIEKLLSHPMKLIELRNSTVALPDSMLAYFSEANKPLGSVDVTSGDTTVVLPVSPARILVASSDRLKITDKALLDGICSASYEFFVHPHDQSFLRKRQSKIGRLSGDVLSNSVRQEFAPFL